jgi:uncharacterized protein YkwD
MTEAAGFHADDLARHNLVSHARSDGSDPFDRIARYYPHPTGLSENIAAGVAAP